MGGQPAWVDKMRDSDLLAEKLGLGFTEFEVYTDQLFTNPRHGILPVPILGGGVMKRDNVKYNDVSCIVTQMPIRVGERWKVRLMLVTNKPEAFVKKIIEEKDIPDEVLTPFSKDLRTVRQMGVRIKRPNFSASIITNGGCAEHDSRSPLRIKYDYLFGDPDTSLDEKGLKELDSYLEQFRFANDG